MLKMNISQMFKEFDTYLLPLGRTAVFILAVVCVALFLTNALATLAFVYFFGGKLIDVIEIGSLYSFQTQLNIIEFLIKISAMYHVNVVLFLTGFWAIASVIYWVRQ